MAEVTGDTATGAGRHHAALRSLARESLLSLIGSVTAGALSLLLPIVVTRQLATHDAGVFFEATALFMVLLNLGTLGADTGVLRSLPQAQALGESNTIGVYLRTAIRWPVVCAVVVGLALALSAPQIGALLVGDTGSADDAMTTCLYIVAGMLPVTVAYTVGVSATRGLGSIRVLVLVDKIGKGFLQLLLVLGAVVVIDTAAGAVAGWTLAYLIGLLVVAHWIVRYRRRRGDSARQPTSRADRSALVRSFWAFSAPRAVSRVCNVAMQRADVLLVGALLGAADAALYAAATRFLVIGTMFVQSIQQVMAPKISEAVALDDNDRARAIYQTTTTWLTLISWPIYLLSASFASLLLGVFGPSYTSGWPTVVILCLTMLVATSCGPVDSVLLMAGRSMQSLGNAVLALLVMVVIDLVLIPELGITGAAIGWSVGILVKNLMALWQVNVGLRMHPFGQSLLIAAAGALTCFGVIPAIANALLDNEVMKLGVSICVGTAVYAVGVAVFRLTFRLDGLSIRRS
ncbi:oligosaccharide flippase family protein [Nocardioidaceae bacterium SCSIO 66511]|nr:oligosaccharide flippase family protein [Nocardioidaceae bacterium SCSIO 66511]